MVENLVFARPYAKAIFALALEQNKIEQWEQFLDLASLILEDKNARELLDDPSITLTKKLDFFFSLMQENIVEDLNAKSIINLLKILASKHHFNIIPEIKDFYKKIILTHANILPVKVISAFDLEKAQIEKMQKVLEKKFQSNIEIDCATNSDLIGGAVIHIADWVIDGSIKGKLKKLREEFRLD